MEEHLGLFRFRPGHPGPKMQPLPSTCFLPSVNPILRHPRITATDVGFMRRGQWCPAVSCGCCRSSCFAAGAACGNGAEGPTERALLLRPLSIREPSVACSQEQMSCLFTFASAKTHSANEVARLVSDELETIWRDNASGAPKRRNAFWTFSTSRQDGTGGRIGAAGVWPPEQERKAEATATALPPSQNMPLPGTGAIARPREFEASLRSRTRERKKSRELTRFDTNLPLSGVIAANAAEPAWPRESNAYTCRGVSREAWPEGCQQDGLSCLSASFSALRCCDCLNCRQQVPAAESSTCFWPRSPRFPVSRPAPPPLERPPGDWKRRCWCCDEYGHKYSQCTKPFGLRRRCFGCGLPDHTKATCPNCSPNYPAEVIRFVSSSK